MMLATVKYEKVGIKIDFTSLKLTFEVNKLTVYSKLLFWQIKLKGKYKKMSRIGDGW